MRGYLPKQIDKAKKNMNESIANVLYNEVALPLEKISREVGMHWPNPDPLLWKELSKFREMKLSRLIKIAEEKNDKLLVDELKFTFTYIYRILNLQRYRMNPQIENEWKKNYLMNADSMNELFESNNITFGENQLVRESKSNVGIKQDGNLIYEFLKKYLEGKKGITKLAIPIALQIELATGRKPTSEEVIKELKARIDDEDILLEKTQYGVMWITECFEEKEFSKEACGVALKRWEKARAEADNKTLDRQ